MGTSKEIDEIPKTMQIKLKHCMWDNYMNSSDTQKVMGSTASIHKLTYSIHRQSKLKHVMRPTLALYYLQIFRWFRDNNAKDYLSKETLLIILV